MSERKRVGASDSEERKEKKKEKKKGAGNARVRVCGAPGDGGPIDDCWFHGAMRARPSLAVYSPRFA